MLMLAVPGNPFVIKLPPASYVQNETIVVDPPILPVLPQTGACDSFGWAPATLKLPPVPVLPAATK